MKYTIEEIYELVGKDDKTAGLQLIPGTESFKKFGPYITVVFTYTQDEREKMDEMVKAPFTHSGKVKAKYLGWDLKPEQVKLLSDEGIEADDIWEISYFTAPEKNTFHSTEQRAIKKIELPLHMKPKGGDFDWIYGFSKKLVKEGIGLNPRQRQFYLAAKAYFEEAELSDEERAEIYEADGKMTESIEWEYLKIKIIREDITNEQTVRLGELLQAKKQSDYAILDKYLQMVGSSMKKLTLKNIDQAVKMYIMVSEFKERRLNVMGKVPVYLDIDGYLHIYMRHVDDMKINDRFEDKDNFQWATEDVFTVMEKVITSIDNEIQAFFLAHPNTRYSRYGGQSVYFEGDYYTLHIEPSGRISTFHKNKKKAAVAVAEVDEK